MYKTNSTYPISQLLTVIWEDMSYFWGSIFDVFLSSSGLKGGVQPTFLRKWLLRDVDHLVGNGLHFAHCSGIGMKNQSIILYLS